MAGDIKTVHEAGNCWEKLSDFRKVNNKLGKYEFLRINRNAGSRPFMIFKSIQIPKWYFDG